MKKILLFLTAAILIIFPLLVFRSQVESAFSRVYFYSPCDTPITYSIGKIDAGFNTTHEELLEDSKIAANIWNRTQNKTLLKYDPKSEFTVNLVYDTRQELTSKIDELATELEQKQNEIDPKIEDYKKRQLVFEQAVKELNDDISYWNEKGGAPKEEYESLIARQDELKNQAQSLNAEARSLGQETNEYNTNARALNSTIDDYKGVLVTKPEEGLYEQDGDIRKISIFIDVSHDEFLHTLTHEFGHALQLEHNTDKSSIMYPQTSASLTPSKTEIEELDKICEKKALPELFSERLKLVASLLRERFNNAN